MDDTTNKALDDLKNEVTTLQQKLSQDKIEVVENGVHLVLRADLTVELVELDGKREERFERALSSAFKKVIEAQSNKLLGKE